ncbi:MAG: organomercurial lyase [Gemmatimonadaceae bacterium]
MPIDSNTLRVFVYDELLARGVPPTTSEIGAHFGVSPNEAREALAALKIGKTMLVHPRSGEVWMAGPFAAAETPYRLSRGERRWWANCAWDMLGVAMIVGEPVRIDATCTDCGTPMVMECSPTSPPNDDSIVHFLLPARRWYDDIGFT